MPKDVAILDENGITINKIVMPSTADVDSRPFMISLEDGKYCEIGWIFDGAAKEFLEPVTRENFAKVNARKQKEFDDSTGGKK